MKEAFKLLFFCLYLCLQWKKIAALVILVIAITVVITINVTGNKKKTAVHHQGAYQVQEQCPQETHQVHLTDMK